ncbi:MAG TPA: cation:proton antiporter [Rhizomicrobium sp.]|jgi:Kef-type K+ transport system membrane component KefB/nucleotide-binding universal stress UspA family protein|nr:cation:proton antiporter [Rhizomicrobium sp.]
MGTNFRRWGWLIAIVAVLVPVSALAANHGATEPGAEEAILVAEIALLVLVGRLLGEAMLRIGQPSIVGQLLAGVVLGPSVFGKLWPQAHDLIFPHSPGQKAMLAAIAQFGVLLLLLLTGMETDLKLVRRARGTAAAVSLTGIAIPFACGFALGQFLPGSLLPAGHRLVSSLFLGTALSISSIKIVAAVVREMNFMRRNLGQVIVASAIIEDSVGWVIIAVTFGIAQSGGVQGLSLFKTIGGVAVFLAASFTIGQFLVFRIIRWVNDNFHGEFAVVSAILIIMAAMALITYGLGVQTVLGAFVAGILIGESPILTEHIQNQLRGLVAALFMPVFFGQAGINADLSILAQPQLLAVTGLIVAIASIGKFSGAFAGGKLCGMSVRESLALGCGMNARGSTEVIVATIGLSMGALTQSLFTMIVTMAVITTMAMPPMLRSALSRLPIGREEKARLEREELDARGFVAKLERMLVAVDDSASGKFAAELAGYLAGGKGMAATILRIDEWRGSIDTPSMHEGEIKQSAAKAAAATEETEEEAPRSVDVSVQPKDEPPAPEQLSEMARKGFDFLMIGIAGTRAPDGGFSKKVSDLANAFEGPLAILVPPEVGDPEMGESLLVPVTGTDVSRRGAEIAMAIARASGARVAAIYVSATARRGLNERTRRNEEAVLKDIAKLGERYGVRPRTQIERHELAEAPILKEAMKRHDLIVMGVNRRPGENMFFGNTSAALMARWKGAILFISS